jgi:adenylosuccinate synthase
MKAIAVIGMNYGDEGKGHITNYLSNEKTLNVRFNGGAQAAHGVVISDDRYHVFHHFGSGSLKGARTLLGSKFIVNPILFTEEFAALSGKCTMREIFIDPRCRVSTFYDMLVNSFASEHRGVHDTCGVGINETIERSQFRQLRINMRALMEKTSEDIKELLRVIHNEYVPWRLQQLKLPRSDFQRYFDKRVVHLNKTVDAYLNTIRFLKKHSVIWPDDNLIERYLAKESGRQIVLEGAQGMLLSQRRTEYMPYLTRSNTGLKNVREMLRTVRTQMELDVYLVTRTYLTRHGEGPMFHEFSTIPDDYDIKEYTNPENTYQGKMRYGKLDIDWYNRALKEIENAKLPKCVNDFNCGVAVTCLDQHHLDLKNLNNVKLRSYGPYEENIQS